MQKNKKRSDGRLQAQVYLGNKAGKPRYKYVYAASQKELDKKVLEVRQKLGKGLDLTSEKDKFGYWMERWLKLKKISVSAGRYNTYKARANNLQPLYDFRISKLTTSDFQEILIDCATEPNERTGEPYSVATLKEIKNSASQIMKLAVDNRIIDYNPVPAATLPKTQKDKEERRALTDEEQSWIVNTPHRAQTAAMIMMYAGLRRGELLALTWGDIDLKAETIIVNKSVEFTNNRTKIKEGGKTKAATRTVYIPSVLADYLRSVPGEHIGLVVTKKDGRPMTDSAWKRLWDSYLSDLNLKYGDWHNCLQTKGKKPSKYGPQKKPMLIPRFTAHWLRHTFITLMYMAGVDLLTAKEQAGHEDIETTMSIYTHLDEKYKKKSISKLNEYINSGRLGEKKLKA
ncbi:MAG: tyrosine-type recombinase/integrase [Ruminiclostridium sp.]